MTWVFASDAPPAGSTESRVLLLGGKAANLATMALDLGLPVPPAFTISTEACRAYLATGWPDGLDEEVRAAMAALETRVGRRFGDVDDPLLVSVRSGAPRSMPGMMDTILNLGLNDETEAGLARASGDAAFAADCLRRFREQYASVVGSAAPSDPWDQLRGAIEAVFRSWLSERARAYRQAEGIPDDLGTGVTVQAMVFGNRGPDSGTGVLFTRNPATGEAELYGDVLFDAQGEDVVAGTHATEPVSGLAARMPAIFDALQGHAATLERHFRDCCDIEFTIEAGRLWLLQTRVGKRTPQAALRMAVEMAEDPAFPLSREEAVRRVLPLLASPPVVAVAGADRPVADRRGARRITRRGIGRDPADACHRRRWRRRRPRRDPRSRRDLARRRDRHARESRGPDVAWRLRQSRRRRGARLGDPGGGRGGRRCGRRRVRVDRRAAPRRGRGDLDRRDDRRGLRRRRRRAGPRSSRRRRSCSGGPAPLGIDIDGNDATPASADHAAATRDDALRALLIKGYADGTGLAPAIGSSPDDATRLITELAGDGLAEPGAGSFRLTHTGREAATSLLEADRAAWGSAAAEAALDAFLDLDARMKSIVTDWQMRDAQTINDHSDEAYDSAVLTRLAELHRDVEAWLSPLVAGLPRLARYGARLGAAADAAVAGNARFVASPRVDSYHGAWFELHEDLIRLAGRTRESETAAGRA